MRRSPAAKSGAGSSRAAFTMKLGLSSGSSGLLLRIFTSSGVVEFPQVEYYDMILRMGRLGNRAIFPNWVG